MINNQACTYIFILRNCTAEQAATYSQTLFTSILQIHYITNNTLKYDQESIIHGRYKLRRYKLQRYKLQRFYKISTKLQHYYRITGYDGLINYSTTTEYQVMMVL